MTDEFLHPSECLDSLVQKMPYNPIRALNEGNNLLNYSIPITGLSIIGLIIPTPTWIKIASGVVGSITGLVTYVQLREMMEHANRHEKLLEENNKVYYWQNGFVKKVTEYEKKHAKEVIPVNSIEELTKINPQKQLVLLNGVEKKGYERTLKVFDTADHDEDGDEWYNTDLKLDFAGTEIIAYEWSMNPIMEEYIQENTHYLIIGEKDKEQIKIKYVSKAAKKPEDIELI